MKLWFYRTLVNEKNNVSLHVISKSPPHKSCPVPYLLYRFQSQQIYCARDEERRQPLPIITNHTTTALIGVNYSDIIYCRGAFKNARTTRSFDNNLLRGQKNNISNVWI